MISYTVSQRISVRLHESVAGFLCALADAFMALRTVLRDRPIVRAPARTERIYSQQGLTRHSAYTRAHGTDTVRCRHVHAYFNM